MKAGLLGTMIDDWHKLRMERMASEKIAEEFKKQENLLEQQIIDVMKKEGVAASGGKLLKVELKTSEEPYVEDWDSVYKHVKKTGEFELMFRRINPKAVKERWANGENVPGVVSAEVTKLSRSVIKGN